MSEEYRKDCPQCSMVAQKAADYCPWCGYEFDDDRVMGSGIRGP